MIAAAFLLAAAAPQVPGTVAELPCPTFPIVDPGRIAMLVTPLPRPVTLPPASEADRARFKAWSDLDPAGVCYYRAANAALPPPTPRRVVFMGDSITEAWRLAAPALFSGDVIDRGVSGQTSTQMLSRFQQDLIALRPAVVHIMAGVNDAHRPWGLSVAEPNIRSMVELARAHGIAVVLGAVTPTSSADRPGQADPGPAIAAFNRRLAAYAQEAGIAFVDYHAALSDGAPGIRIGWSNDALHPNQRGYDAMTPLASAAIAGALRARARR